MRAVPATTDRDLRNVLIQLVQAIHRTRTHLMAANMVLSQISNTYLDQPQTLTSERLSSEIKSIVRQLEVQPDPSAVRMLKILEGEGDFLEELRAYVSQLRW